MARQGRIPDFLKEGVVLISMRIQAGPREWGRGRGRGEEGGGKGQMKLRHYINPRTYNGGVDATPP